MNVISSPSQRKNLGEKTGADSRQVFFGAFHRTLRTRKRNLTAGRLEDRLKSGCADFGKDESPAKPLRQDTTIKDREVGKSGKRSSGARGDLPHVQTPTILEKERKAKRMHLQKTQRGSG